MKNRINEDSECRLIDSFPANIKKHVEIVTDLVHKVNHKEDIYDFCYSIKNIVSVRGEKLCIPGHFNLLIPNKEMTSSLNMVELKILKCIFSRHSNGYIRQSMVESLIQDNDYFLIPFFIALMEEYVSEILYKVYEHVVNNTDLYIEFTNENIEYWTTVKKRIVSYWNEYYRKDEEINKSDYIGFKIVKLIENAYE